jgi:hypothetical protein
MERRAVDDAAARSVDDAPGNPVVPGSPSPDRSKSM